MVKITAFKNEYRQKLLSCAKLGLDNLQIAQIESDLDNANDSFEYLICIDDEDNLLGFSKTTKLEKGFLRLDQIFVAPEFRRDSNGSLILVAVMTRAVNKLMTGILAFCPEDKTEALAFFKARGFTCFSVENQIHAFTKSLLYMYKTEHKD